MGEEEGAPERPLQVPEAVAQRGGGAQAPEEAGGTEQRAAG